VAEALAHLPYCQALDADTQAHLRNLTLRFLRARPSRVRQPARHTACGAVALQACLLILNLDFDFYAAGTRPFFTGDFLFQKNMWMKPGWCTTRHEELSGESWNRTGDSLLGCRHGAHACTHQHRAARVRP